VKVGRVKESRHNIYKNKNTYEYKIKEAARIGVGQPWNYRSF
jgi:hypothetical protein